MNPKKSKIRLSIWGLVVGFFFFYVPYSAMTKILSLGLFSRNALSISGFELLPTILFGSVIGFVGILWATGWWRHAGTVKLFGKNVPFATNRYTFFSGVATAVIIATTTLGYSFTGVSIVFVALLMKGGVLLVAVFVDSVYHRKIHLYSWIAFGLVLFSLLISFSEKAGFNITLVAGINVLAYVAGYFFRLRFMTAHAKTDNHSSTYRYFVEEMLSVIVVIFFLPILLAIIGQGEVLLSIRAGYVSFLSSGLVLPAIIIGLLYSGLYVFGTCIYLDHRENTFCIPINRCGSILAVVTSGILLSFIFKKQFYTSTQLMSAGVLIIAILVLCSPALVAWFRRNTVVSQHAYMFVCPGNTGRSPMAQSICIHLIMKHLKTIGAEQKFGNYRVMSSAISGEAGLPMEEDAQLALKYLGVPVEEHKSEKLTAENIMQAGKIWCMSAEHKQQILEKFPEAGEKLYSLDDAVPIPAPHGKGVDAYIECARRLQQAVELIVGKEIAFA